MSGDDQVADEPSEPDHSRQQRDRAVDAAQRYLERIQHEFVSPDVEALQHLDADRARYVISGAFEALFDIDLDALDQGYMYGNEIVELVAALQSHLGASFELDLSTLAEIYCSRHPDIESFRAQWNREHDDTVIWFGTSFLAASWQLAWTISRAGLAKALEALEPLQASDDERIRRAARDLVEDVTRWSRVVEPPLYGGGTGPPRLDVDETTYEESASDESAYEDPYGEV